MIRNPNNFKMISKKKYQKCYNKHQEKDIILLYQLKSAAAGYLLIKTKAIWKIEKINNNYKIQIKNK